MSSAALLRTTAPNFLSSGQQTIKIEYPLELKSKRFALRPCFLDCLMYFSILGETNYPLRGLKFNGIFHLRQGTTRLDGNYTWCRRDGFCLDSAQMSHSSP